MNTTAAPPGEQLLAQLSDEHDRQFVTALARGLELLRCFDANHLLLGNRELAAQTGLPKATVSRLTYTLTKLGYLRRHPRHNKYRLAGGVLALGYAQVSNSQIRKLARPPMQALADYANASTALVMRDRLNMVYLENCHPAVSTMTRLEAGSRIPLATTSSGRACLAALSDGERIPLLDQLRRQDPANWPTWQRGIAQAIEDYQQHGYCLSIGEWEKDINAVAVPLRLDDGDVLAFNCGGPAFRIHRQLLEDDLGPQLRELVRDIGGSTAHH